MSTADVAGQAGPVPAGGAAVLSAVRHWLRLLRSELGLVFGRRRNLALLAVLAAVPVLLGLVLRLSHGGGGGGGNGQGPAFLSQVTGNGVFLAFLALVVESTLILPLAVAVVAGDAIAGEATRGTLRYLLAVPSGRTRLLGIKFTATVVFCVAACLLVAAVAVVVGAILFPVGPVTLLSGTSVPLGDGLLRLLFVALYLGAAMAALGAIGLAISAFTEHPVGAIAAILVIAVASQVADTVSQVDAIHPYLPTHWWLSFDAMLRVPVDWADLGHGLLSFAVYAVIFCSVAWARFTTADVTS
ncbi:MAG TPA: ABC transporter permease subunit [Streptosporangiaceae bacterium]|nr:ABC transporter permease subunit [Streptosporangiaceae bacterium]